MHLRVMTDQDLPSAVRLNTVVGWNQTAADWRRFLLQSPQGCFVMEHKGEVVGTVTTICYENRFAWIGMVLVQPEFRGRGIGTQLLQKAIEYLEQVQIPAVKLDATPQGKPLYAKLGFVEEYEIERWILKRPLPLPDAPPVVRALTDVLLEEVLKLDADIFGADRGFLLRSLYKDSPDLALTHSNDGAGMSYVFGRRGLFADHLGPWMANSRVAAEKLLQEFLAQSARDTVIADCVKDSPIATKLVQAYGFSLSRPLTRMVRGPNHWPGRPDSLCAILGPEFG